MVLNLIVGKNGIETNGVGNNLGSMFLNLLTIPRN